MCYNQDMKKYSLWIIEFFVWLFIITVIILGIQYQYVGKANKKSTYHIFLKDIDGLKKGSPIKIMGVQAGYITAINVVDDYMYISFLITNPEVKIPYGATASVESYGIASSKYIEIYPPTQKNNNEEAILFVKEPIRSSTSFHTQGSISKMLIEMTEGTMNKLSTKTNEQHQENIKNLTRLTSAIEFNKINDKSDELSTKIQNRTKARENNLDDDEN